MLYKNICAVSLSVYALLTSPILGSEYFVAQSGNSHTCTDDANGVCDIHCDGSAKQGTFNCGNAGECNFYCEEQKCAERVTLTASDAGNLHIYVGDDGKECMKKSIINAPNYGNLTIDMGNSHKGLKEMKVYSGTNTQNIIIDINSNTVAGDDCKAMEIYASTAEYLQITLSNGLQWPSGRLECPANIAYPYSGPNIAPCVIDASNGNGIITDTNIIAPDGIPKNLYINGGTFQGTTVTCSNVDVLNGGNEGGSSTLPINIDSDCWWTYDPTIDPTADPTIDPTIDPTVSPSDNPTITPSISPTLSPSQPTPNPTYTPSMNPTVNPTVTPTQFPSGVSSANPTTDTRTPTETPSISPSGNPSYYPSLIPTASPSKYPTDIPTQNPSMQATDNPTMKPTQRPTRSPTNRPSITPTAAPIQQPTKSPLPGAQTHSPTPYPSANPSKSPSRIPSTIPTKSPTDIPSVMPSKNPTDTPSHSPSFLPTNSPIPSYSPTKMPTKAPTQYTPMPTQNPSDSPTAPLPTAAPIYTSTNSDINLTNADSLRVSDGSDINILWWIVLGLIVLLLCIASLLIWYVNQTRKMKRIFSGNYKLKPISTKEPPSPHSPMQYPPMQYPPSRVLSCSANTIASPSVAEGQDRYATNEDKFKFDRNDRVLSMGRDQLEMVTMNKMYTGQVSDDIDEEKQHIAPPQYSQVSPDGSAYGTGYRQWDQFYSQMMNQMQQNNNGSQTGSYKQPSQIEISQMMPNGSVYSQPVQYNQFTQYNNTYGSNNSHVYYNNSRNSSRNGSVQNIYSDMPPSASWKNVPNLNHRMNAWQQNMMAQNNYQLQQMRKESDGFNAIQPNVVYNLANRFEQKTMPQIQEHLQQNIPKQMDTYTIAKDSRAHACNASNGSDMSDEGSEETVSSDTDSNTDTVTQTQTQTTMVIESQNTDTQTMIIESEEKEDTLISRLSPLNSPVQSYAEGDDSIVKDMPHITPQMGNNPYSDTPTNYSLSDLCVGGKIEFQNINCKEPNTPVSTGSMIIHSFGNDGIPNNFNDVKLDMIIDQDMIVSDDEELDMAEQALSVHFQKTHQPRQTTMEFHQNLSLDILGGNALLEDIVNDMATADD